MALLALILAVVALLLALVALVRAGGGGERVLDDARTDARRQMRNLAEETGQELATVRRLLADVAGGAALEREQILEGRLWRDVLAPEAAARVAAGEVFVLDVRTPGETAAGVIPGARQIPIDQLEARLAEVPDGERPTLVYCAAGGRSAAACELLSQSGRSGLLNLAGGIGSWSGPLEKPDRSS